jgi:hypothetical protein
MLKVFILVMAVALHALSQERPASVVVEVKTGSVVAAKALVSINGISVRTDQVGIARASTPLGTIKISVEKEGFLRATVSVVVDEAREWRVQVELQPATHEQEAVTVFATRTDIRLQF